MKNNMSSDDEKVVALKKGRITITTFIAFLIVGLGTLLLSSDGISGYQRGTAYVAIALYGLLGAYLLKKLFNKTPALTFNSSGILDNTCCSLAREIPWSEIISYEVVEKDKTSFLVVKVTEPYRYMEDKEPTQRDKDENHYKTYGTPIVFSSQELKIDFSELLTVIKQYHSKYNNV